MSPAVFGIVFVVAFVAFSIIGLVFVALAHGMSSAARDPNAVWDHLWAVGAAFIVALIVSCVVTVAWWVAVAAWGALT